MRAKIQNSREVKKIREMILSQYGYFLQGNYVFLKNDKNKIFIVNRDIDRIDFSTIRVDKMGLYLGEIYREQFRFSKEGSMFFNKNAQENGHDMENIIDFNKDELYVYFQGEDIGKDLGEESRFYFIRYQEDIICCAQYAHKTIRNFLPKIYRGEVIL